jgi:hypothetical protein
VLQRPIETALFIRTWPSERCDSRWACSGGKLVVSKAGEAYDAQASGLNLKFRLRILGGDLWPYQTVEVS